MTSDQENNSTDGSVYCAHCGTQNGEGAYSCDRCGERIYFPDPHKPPPLGLVECQTCVTSNETRASYCVKCGNSLANAARISVLGGGEGIRQVPHSRPGGIRISPRNRTPESRGTRGVPSQRAVSRITRHRGSLSESNANSGSDLNPNHNDSPIADALSRQKSGGEQTRAQAIEKERERVEEADGPNDSGTRSAKLPASARGWNTAAFLIGPIWGPANGVWLGLIGLLFLVIPESAVPLGWKLLLYLSYSAFLGYRGNEMAWRARRWASLEHFKRVQQQWMLIAVAVALVALIAIPALLN